MSEWMKSAFKHYSEPITHWFNTRNKPDVAGHYPLLFQRRDIDPDGVRDGFDLVVEAETLFRIFDKNREEWELAVAPYASNPEGQILAEGRSNSLTVFAGSFAAINGMENMVRENAIEPGDGGQAGAGYQYLGPGLLVPDHQFGGARPVAEQVEFSEGWRFITVVLDADIPFLNERFRRNEAETRILAHWNMDAPPGGGPVTDLSPLRGRAMFENEINGLLRELSPAVREMDIYLREQAFPDGYGLTHGAHVLDCAAGRFFQHDAERAQGHAIISVQLPRDEVAEANGYVLRDSVFAALDWVQAVLARFRQQHGDIQYVVNYSLGPYAGRDDGQDALALELEDLVVDDPALPREMVTLPVGNSLQTQTHGVFAQPDLPVDLAAPGCTAQWVIQPDSKAEHFAQIWLPVGVGSDAVRIRLSPPGGLPPSPLLTVAGIDGEGVWHLEEALGGGANQVLAEISWLVDDRLGVDPRTCITIATCPTSAQNGEPEVPFGVWRIELWNQPGVEMPLGEAHCVEFWAERSDTPNGFPVGGKQSYFADENYIVRDNFEQYEMADTPATYVRREGTISPLARGVRCFSCGSHVASTGEPHFFSSRAGADHHFRSVTSGQSPAQDYTGGTGIVSNSVVRASGTSVSCALAARAIADGALDGNLDAVIAELNGGVLLNFGNDYLGNTFF